MNALTNFTTAKTLTMSSREIADLLDTRHDTVKVSIERLSGKGLFTLPAMQETSFIGKDGKTQWVSVYLLEKRPSYIVVAQLSPEFTAALVDRWQELEEAAKGPALPNFTDPVAAAEAWIESYKRAQEQAHLLAVQTAKVEELAEDLKFRRPHPAGRPRMETPDGRWC